MNKQCKEMFVIKMVFFFLLCKNVSILQINSFLLRGYFFIEIILQSTIDNTEIVYYATEIVYYATESIKMSRHVIN